MLVFEYHADPGELLGDLDGGHAVVETGGHISPGGWVRVRGVVRGRHGYRYFAGDHTTGWGLVREGSILLGFVGRGARGGEGRVP